MAAAVLGASRELAVSSVTTLVLQGAIQRGDRTKMIHRLIGSTMGMEPRMGLAYLSGWRAVGDAHSAFPFDLKEVMAERTSGSAG